MTRDTKISGLKKKPVTDYPSSSLLDHKKQVACSLHLHFHLYLCLYISVHYDKCFVFTQRHYSASFIPEPPPSNHQFLSQPHHLRGNPVLRWSKLWQWDWLVKTALPHSAHCCQKVLNTQSQSEIQHGLNLILFIYFLWCFFFLQMSYFLRSSSAELVFAGIKR